MRIGLVYNPNAGDRLIRENLMRILAKKLEGHDLVCTKATHAYIKSFFTKLSCVGSEKISNSYVDSVNAGRSLLNVDLVVVVGGDGTISDVVMGQKQKGIQLPIIGIAYGTANAGPLITFKSFDELKRLNLKKFKKKIVPGIDVYNERNEFIAAAFNDVVFSDCVVSTMNGKSDTVDAKGLLEGVRIKKVPSFVGTDRTKIIVDGKKVSIPFDIGQIILSPIQDKRSYAYKAVLGKFCWLAYSDKDAAMVISAEPVVKFVDPGDLAATLPMYLSQFIFGKGDVIEISGTKGFAVIDGNPRIDMEKNSAVAKIVFNNSAAITLDVEMEGM